MQEPETRRYAAAGGVVVDSAGGRILILLVPDRATPDHVLEVRLPKGHIEPGEGRDQAARREVFEETGLADVEIVADLGCQSVEFDHNGRHVVREESYFLMVALREEGWGEPEPKFERAWLSWEQAVGELTYEPEREWVRRARQAWAALGDRDPGIPGPLRS